MFDEDFWEHRYRSHEAVWSGRANPQLVAEVNDVAPGRALDAGCGEGADALWLASRGWQVTAADISATAVQRGAAQSARSGVEMAERVKWVHADLIEWSPPEGSFDLVSVQYMHAPSTQRVAMFARLAAAVAPGGTLLIVGHHPDDLRTTIPRPPMPDLFYTAESLADALDPDFWDVLVAESRPRSASDPEGRQVTIHDAVLRARRCA